MTSEAYIAAAAEALEKSGQATHNTEAMRVHAYRAGVLLDMARTLAEREESGQVPIEPALPAAFLDCHDRRWVQVGDDGDYRLTAFPDGVTTSPNHALTLHITSIREGFGPLRAVEA